MITIQSEYFGTSRSGEAVNRYTMKNEAGMTVRLINYACIVQSLLVPDKDGTLRDVVLGYDDLESYEKGTLFFGAFIGRYANRIRNSAFLLDGREYRLPANDGKNHLHGTYGDRVFPAELCGNAVVFSGISPDGEEGYPGRLEFRVSYELTEDSRLVITYEAWTDAPTVVNLTNHSYFNLNGQTESGIHGHVLSLSADSFLEGAEDTTPTGRILPVCGTPMDFVTAPAQIGRQMDLNDTQLGRCSGFDHNFIINGQPGTLRHAATLYSPESGITMHCLTTQPGMQLYTANFVKGPSAVGKGGIVYPVHGAVCLETQHYPCSPNFQEFPTTVLRPGETYREITVYTFEH